jgi:hypothetical protein
MVNMASENEDIPCTEQTEASQIYAMCVLSTALQYLSLHIRVSFPRVCLYVEYETMYIGVW